MLRSLIFGSLGVVLAAVLLLGSDLLFAAPEPLASVLVVCLLWGVASTVHMERMRVGHLTAFAVVFLVAAMGAWLIVGLRDLAHHQFTLFYGAVGLAGYFSVEIRGALRRARQARARAA